MLVWNFSPKWHRWLDEDLKKRWLKMFERISPHPDPSADLKVQDLAFRRNRFTCPYSLKLETWQGKRPFIHSLHIRQWHEFLHGLWRVRYLNCAFCTSDRTIACLVCPFFSWNDRLSLLSWIWRAITDEVLSIVIDSLSAPITAQNVSEARCPIFHRLPWNKILSNKLGLRSKAPISVFWAAGFNRGSD